MLNLLTDLLLKLKIFKMGLSETKIADEDSELPTSGENNGDVMNACSSNKSGNLPRSPPDLAATASTDNTQSVDSRPESRFKLFAKRDVDFLVGNLERLPDSARKLFNVAKLYLTSQPSESNSEIDFTSLFQTLPEAGPEEDDVDKDSTHAPLKLSDNLFMPLKKSAPLHFAQTYIQWKSAQDVRNFYAFCLPKRRTIYLQPIDEFPDFISTFRLKTLHMNLNLFETLQGFAQIFFSGLEVFIRSPLLMEAHGWSVRSRYHKATNKLQYCVNDLYPQLQSILPGDGVCIAGIMWTDIYPEGYNFVLGEASIKHQAAVVSFGRFEPSGFNQDTHCDVTEVTGILLWKLLKSLSHELCHLFGLEHCTFFVCAMNESSCLSDALSQPLFLCPVCLRKLQRACGFDVLERYQQLRVFLSMLVGQLEHTSKFEESVAWLDRCIEFLNS